MRAVNISLLAAALGKSVEAAALTFQDTNSLFRLAPRAATCPATGSYNQCGSQYPGNWCCSSDKECIPLNVSGTKAVICCPKGSSCSTVKLISCDATLQDPSSHPESTIFTSNLLTALPACGGKCCPAGFTCDKNDQFGDFCRMVDTVTSSGSSPSSTKSSTASSAATSRSATVRSGTTQTPVPAAEGSPATTPPSASQAPASLDSAQAEGKSASKPNIVAAAVVPTLLALIAIGAILFWLRRKRTTKRKISEPIYNPQMAARTDFLNRYQPPSPIDRSRSRLSNAVAGLSAKAAGKRPATGDSDRPLTQITQLQQTHSAQPSTYPSPNQGTPTRASRRDGTGSRRPSIRRAKPPPAVIVTSAGGQSSRGGPVGIPASLQPAPLRPFAAPYNGHISAQSAVTKWPTPGSSPGPTLTSARFDPHSPGRMH